MDRLYFILDPRGTIAVMARSEEAAWLWYGRLCKPVPSTVAIIGPDVPMMDGFHQFDHLKGKNAAQDSTHARI